MFKKEGCEKMFDYVHDTQIIFRKLVDGMSRPGTVGLLQNQVSKLKQIPVFYRPLAGIAFTLVDREVSFHVVGEPSKELEDLIQSYTLAQVKDVDQADYIFITSQASKENIEHAIRQAKTGTLRSPEHSATIILETSIFSNGNLLMEGPGIESSISIAIGHTDVLYQSRLNKNVEYPLGLDFILIDEQAQIVCIPRTTNLKLNEVS